MDLISSENNLNYFDNVICKVLYGAMNYENEKHNRTHSQDIERHADTAAE